ncbi:MAG: hypothetical protein KPEEDBHJ_02292 [Anaerolineales bacterium]|nr:hypothetical protein [Anaerolineales bacterium]
MKRIGKRARETNQSRILIARILFHVNFLLWLGMGVFYVYKIAEDGNAWPAVMVSFFFCVAAFSLLFAAQILSRRGKRIYFTLVFVAGLNVFLTFFGFQDFPFIIAALLDIVILANLIPLKDHYVAQA